MHKLKLSILPLLLVLAACAGTKSAYQAADTLEEQAYVVTEHYAAVLKEAADLAPSLPAHIKAELQAADRKVKPLVTGLAPLVQRYETVRNAQTEAELQAAVNDALIALTEFVNTLKQARNAQ